MIQSIFSMDQRKRRGKPSHHQIRERSLKQRPSFFKKKSSQHTDYGCIEDRDNTLYIAISNWTLNSDSGAQVKYNYEAPINIYVLELHIYMYLQKAKALTQSSEPPQVVDQV